MTKSLEEATRSKKRPKAPDIKEVERYMEVAKLHCQNVGAVADEDEIEHYVTERIADDMGVLPFNLSTHIRQTINRTVRGES